MSRTGLSYGAENVYEALYFMEADPKAYKGREDGVYVFEYTEEIKKAHEAYVKNRASAKITLDTAAKNFGALGVSLAEGAAPKRRGRKPGRPAGKKPGRKPGRPAGKKRGRKPGRPAGKKRGRKPGRPAGMKPGRKPGRPAGKKLGRPKKASAIKLVPPEQRAKIEADIKALLDQKKDRAEIMAALKPKFGGQAVAGSLRRMNIKKK